jgi:(2Fe-2S) ferredoxin
MQDGPAGAQPVYLVHVFCCTNERPATHWRGSCGERGGRELCDYMCRLGMALGARRIRINRAGCMNVCEHGPVMVVYPEAVWYKYETHADVDEIMRSHIIGGVRVERLVVSIDPATLHG